MRSMRVVSALVAATVIFAPAGLFVAGVRPVPFENKPLTELPGPDQGWEALEMLPAWATDNLPAREQAVGAASWIDFFVLGTLPDRVQGASAVNLLPGPDGPTRTAPQVVRGQDDYLFLGQDFDSACVADYPFANWLTGWLDLARSIADTGREVVFTVTPNKSSHLVDELPAAVPHGECSRRGIDQQNDILDDVDDPLYLDVRTPLRALDQGGEQSFWKSDTHFSPAGSAAYATALADRLEPGLSDDVGFDTTPVTRVGDLARLAGLSYPETLPGARVETGATAQFMPRPTAYDTPEDFAAVHAWRSRPSSRTVPGRTAVIGDSFTYYSLPALSPLFARGEFYWISVDPPEEIARAVEAADTVVIQVVERYVGPYGGGNRDAIRAAVDTALATAPRG